MNEPKKVKITYNLEKSVYIFLGEQKGYSPYLFG